MKPFALILFIFILTGCSRSETDPSRYQCDWYDEGLSWSCVKDGVAFDCSYKERRGIENSTE
jgi:hypothetical protein